MISTSNNLSFSMTSTHGPKLDEAPDGRSVEHRHLDPTKPLDRLVSELHVRYPLVSRNSDLPVLIRLVGQFSLPGQLDVVYLARDIASFFLLANKRAVAV